MSAQIRASVIGASGYTGSELLRILLGHKDVEISFLTSRSHDGTPVGRLYPRLAHVSDLLITKTDPVTAAKNSDVVFLCLPHETTQEVVPDIIGKTKIIDLSADFRLRDPQAYKNYYSGEHKCPEMLDGRFVYGLPELFRDAIKDADAVANPGCYAQLIEMMLYPFKGNMERAHVSAVSGMSGAGRSPVDPALFPVSAQSMHSYKINEHRHRPEILQTLEMEEEQFDFVPTVGPFMRGIFATAFLDLKDPSPCNAEEVYEDSPFIRVREQVQLANTAGTNFVDLSYMQDAGGTGSVIVQGVLDNLLKGASGTAVQNMNLMFGLDEAEGLGFTAPLYP